jgi:hypothetical protein
MTTTCTSSIQDSTCGVKHRTTEKSRQHSETLNNLHLHPFGRIPKDGVCLGCSGSYLDYTPTELFSYTVEILDRPYTGRIPWSDATRTEGLTERTAIFLYQRQSAWLNPEADCWSGHVRIVGSFDGWVYTVVPPMLGERSTLARLYHLDDIAS